MHDPVENPVAEHAPSYCDRSCTIPTERPIRYRCKRRPACRRKQAVRDWVAHEIERRDDRGLGIDTDGLPTQQEKNWPQQVEQQWRGNQPAQRSPRCDSLRCEANTEVPNDHRRQNTTDETGASLACRCSEFTGRGHVPTPLMIHYRLCNRITQSVAADAARTTAERPPGRDHRDKY